MRFKIIARSQHKPHPFILKLSDGRTVRDTLNWVNHKVCTGDTGVMQGALLGHADGQPKIRLYHDAIDLEYVTVG
jgi:hypothetical protein